MSKSDFEDDAIFNYYSDAFLDVYNQMEKINSYFNYHIGQKPIGSATLRRLQALTKQGDQVDEKTLNKLGAIHNIVAPMAEQITNFATQHLFFLDLPSNNRMKNISMLSTSLLPAIDQLKHTLKTFVTNKMLYAGVNKMLKKPIVVKPAKVEQLEQGKKQAFFFKPNDKMIAPTEQTLKTLQKAKELYDQIMVRPKFAKKNPLVASIEKYKNTTFLKADEDRKIAESAQALISELSEYKETNETIVSTMNELKNANSNIRTLNWRISVQNNRGEQATQFVSKNPTSVVVPNNKTVTPKK